MINQEIDNQKLPNNILNVSEKSLKTEIMYFKEELLKDMKTSQKIFSEKFSKVDDYIKIKIEQYELKLNSFENKIIELSNRIQTDKTIREKVESLTAFKESTKDALLSDSIKIRNLEKFIKDNISYLENILTNSVIYPGIIGGAAKFKTFHDFIDFILIQVANLNKFKDKSIFDLVPYKKKIDITIEELKFQLNNIIESTNKFTTQNINVSEEKTRGLIALYDDRLQDTRVD